MSILSAYKNVQDALYKQIEILTNRHGSSPEFRSDDTLFLPVEVMNLSICGKSVIFINSTTALNAHGLEYNIKCLESDGKFGNLAEAIDKLTETYAVDDDQDDLIIIRGYRTEEDLDDHDSVGIDLLTQQEWDNGEGAEVIKVNERHFYHIEAINKDGKILS